MFALADGYLTALAVTEDGAVLAAAGTQGHVYRVSPDRTASLVVDLPERQALTLLRWGAAFLVGTGDVGGVYRAQPPAAAGGRYLSKVLDAEFKARWGTLRWLGTAPPSGPVGNTAKPDSGVGWKAGEKHTGSEGGRSIGSRASDISRPCT